MSLRLLDRIPILICDETSESIRFYCEQLGFSVVDRMDEIGRSGWAMLQHGSIRLMLASPDYIPTSPKIDGQHQQALHYFYPEDLSALREKLIADGWPVSDFKDRFYGMREFETTDPSGHRLVFGQPVEGADKTTP